jgi:lipopolysaccharide exporter
VQSRPSLGLARITVRAGAWTIVTGLGTRFVGVIGTLVLTHFIAPYDYGEVSMAGVMAWTANQFSAIGVGTYILANPKGGRDMMFHATFLHILFGVVAFALLLSVGGRLGVTFDAPTVGRYLPGMVLAMVIERVIFMPERVMVRRMHFGPLSIARGTGELAYTAVSIVTAVRGWGGMSIVAGNLARSGLRMGVMAIYVHWRDWIQPARLRLKMLGDMIRFGAAATLSGMAHFSVRRWDNLVVSRFFGPAVMGTYNLAYNLADIPAVQVGEQICDVLQAAFSRIEGIDARQALRRSARMLSFIMTPLAVGLACIAPTLAATMFDKRWAGVGNMLMVLAVISFTRPISDTIGGYLQVRQRQGLVALLDVATFALLMGALFTIGRHSPLAACAAVGLAFTARLLMHALAVKILEGIPLSAFLLPLFPPVAACGPMVLAVAAVHRWRPALAHGHLAVLLVVEIVVGALAYGAGALVFARAQTREMLSLLRTGLGRTR